MARAIGTIRISSTRQKSASMYGGTGRSRSSKLLAVAFIAGLLLVITGVPAVSQDVGASDGSNSAPTDTTSSDNPTDGATNTDSGSTDSGSTTGSNGLPPLILAPPGGVIRYNLVGGPSDIMICPPVSIASFARTSNQHAVGVGLDAICGTATGNSANLRQQILGLPTIGERQAALGSLGGEIYGTAQAIGLQVADRSLRAITDRIVGNRAFLNRSDSLFLANRTDPMSASSDLVVRGQPAMADSNAWIEGYGTGGSFGYNGNSVASSFNLGGLAFGFDLGHDDTGSIGIAGGSTSTTFQDDLGDRGWIQSYQVGLYGVKHFDNAYGFLALNYGHNQNDINRPITIGNINSIASSSFVGHQFGSYGETGLNLDGPGIRMQPFVGMQYLYLSNSRANENGGGGAALNVAAANYTSLQSHVGTRVLLYALTNPNGVRWTPYLNGRWVSDLIGNQASAFASLSGAPAGASWVVTGNHAGRNFAMIGPGLTVQLTCQISLFANYDYQWAGQYHAHTGSGGLLFAF